MLIKTAKVFRIRRLPSLWSKGNKSICVNNFVARGQRIYNLQPKTSLTLAIVRYNDKSAKHNKISDVTNVTKDDKCFDAYMLISGGGELMSLKILIINKYVWETIQK